jgi:5-methylcytosine-specific restriction protein A
MAVHPCPVPHCEALLEPGVTRCPRHRTHYNQQRANNNARGYTYQWQLRASLFRERFPFCGMRPGERAPVMSDCYEGGRLTPATQVDHVVPHRGNVDLFWDEANNWQSLCAACGTRKTRAGL